MPADNSVSVHQVTFLHGVADLDDTLVLTGEADLKAYGDVAAHAQQRFPNVQPGLVNGQCICIMLRDKRTYTDTDHEVNR